MEEVHAEYARKEEVEQREHELEQVRQLLHLHLPSAWETSPALEDMPPLTVGDVVARMQADEAVRGSVKQELTHFAQQLQRSNEVLLGNLGTHGIRDLFARLGIRASKQLQKMFSETALFLSSGRQQGMAQLAATRRQRERSSLKLIPLQEPPAENTQKLPEEED